MVKVSVKCAFTDYRNNKIDYQESENFYFKQELEAIKFIDRVGRDNTIILQGRTGCITSIEFSRIEKLQEYRFEVE